MANAEFDIYTAPTAGTDGLTLGSNLNSGVATTGISTPPPEIVDPEV